MPPARLPPALLLDLDDTIVSYSIGKPDFWQLALVDLAASLCSDRGTTTLCEGIQKVASHYWADLERAARGRLDLQRARRQIARAAFAELGLDAPSVADAVADRYTELKEAAVAPFPGAIDALRALQGRGIRLGLVTNGGSAFQRAKLARYELEHFFEVVVVEGELGVGKPHARAFEAALSGLGVEARDAWMVGDNLEADIAGGRAVGLFTVWHNPLGERAPTRATEPADLEIRHLRDLLELTGDCSG